MSDSIITQCPNCSTTFRVSDEVLNMAEGKVRCGQCFHIFAAEPHESNHISSELKRTPITDNTNKKITNVPSAPKAPVEPLSPPEWLNSLVEKETDDQDELTPYQQRVLSERKQRLNEELLAQEVKHIPEETVEKAPWEIELAKLEAMQSLDSQKTPEIKPKKEKAVEKSTKQPAKSKPLQEASIANNFADQPEYMQALQQLAQSSASQKSNNIKAAEYKKDAQQKLSELIEETPDEQKEEKTTPKRHTFLWFVASSFAAFVITAQLLYFNFEQGSRSTSLRPIYNVICTYSGCAMPTFEDVKSIDIQYVRVQSHPTQSNALLVNAIMTNISPFSQPMPKLALEFFDLNGSPIAARLFSQENFLDKDFLDITYMPPNTPIHLVISIADPGAAAVTHQLTAYKANTRAFE